MADRIFEVVYIRASAQDVWRALTDPDMTERYWMGTRIESDWKTSRRNPIALLDKSHGGPAPCPRT